MVRSFFTKLFLIYFLNLSFLTMNVWSDDTNPFIDIDCSVNLLHNEDALDNISSKDTIAEIYDYGNFDGCWKFFVKGNNDKMGFNKSNYYVKLAYKQDGEVRGNRIDIIIFQGLTTDYNAYGEMADYIFTNYKKYVFRVIVTGIPTNGGSDYSEFDYNVNYDGGNSSDSDEEIGDVTTNDVINALGQQLISYRDSQNLSSGQIGLIGWSRGGQMIINLQYWMMNGAFGDYTNLSKISTLINLISSVPPHEIYFSTWDIEILWTLFWETWMAIENWGSEGAIVEIDSNKDFREIWCSDGQHIGDDQEVIYGNCFQDNENIVSSTNSFESFTHACQVMGVLGFYRPSGTEKSFPLSTFNIGFTYLTHDSYISKGDMQNQCEFFTGESESTCSNLLISGDSSHASYLDEPAKIKKSLSKLIPEFTLSTSDVLMQEGRTAEIILKLKEPAKYNLNFSYYTQGITAFSPRDYVGVGTGITFLSGETQKTISIDTKSDFVVEGNETFYVIITDDVQTVQSTVTISDVEIPINLVDKSYNETNATYNTSYLVSLTEDFDGDKVEVTYEIISGTATQDFDYTSSYYTGEFTLTPDSSSKNLSFKIKSDYEDEGDEVFYLNVSMKYYKGDTIVDFQDSASLTIIDDDASIETCQDQDPTPNEPIASKTKLKSSSRCY